MWNHGEIQLQWLPAEGGVSLGQIPSARVPCPGAKSVQKRGGRDGGCGLFALSSSALSQGRKPCRPPSSSSWSSRDRGGNWRGQAALSSLSFPTSLQRSSSFLHAPPRQQRPRARSTSSRRSAQPSCSGRLREPALAGGRPSLSDLLSSGARAARRLLPVAGGPRGLRAGGRPPALQQSPGPGQRQDGDVSGRQQLHLHQGCHQVRQPHPQRPV